MEITKGDTETRLLEVKLTKPELRGYATQLAEENIELLETEDRKKETAAEFNKEVKAHRKIIKGLSEKVSTETEERGVACTWEFDWDNDKKSLMRDDTGEVVTCGPIDEHDRQMHLGDGEDNVEPTEDGTEDDSEPTAPLESDETAGGDAEENHEDQPEEVSPSAH